MTHHFLVVHPGQGEGYSRSTARKTPQNKGCRRWSLRVLCTGMAVYPEKLGEANGKRKCGTFLRTLYEGTGVHSDRRSILFFIIEIEK
jgi:hypothetical protein